MLINPCLMFPPTLPALQTVQVQSCAELRDALGDSGVERVQMLPVEGGWQCSEQDLPRNSVEIVGRQVLLEGLATEQLYYDVSADPPFCHCATNTCAAAWCCAPLQCACMWWQVVGRPKGKPASRRPV